MPESAWPLSRNGLVLFLLLFSSLIATQSVTGLGCGAATGDLYELPACAVLLMYPFGLAENAYLTSATPQTIIALPGQNVSFSVVYQVWQSKLGCAVSWCAEAQLLFIPSWTSLSNGSVTTWWTVYTGVPPSNPPGVTGSAVLHLKVPIEPGTYYLWFCISYMGFGTSWSKPTTPGYIKIIVPAYTSTVTVTSVASSRFSIPFVPVGAVGFAVVVLGTAVIAVRKGKVRIRRRKAESSMVEKPTISTGYPDLDGTLAGGIPEGYAVVLVSPSYDERDLLLRKIIDSAISTGRPSFYISGDIEKTQDLFTRYKQSFYAFSPLADRIQPKPPNLYGLPGIDNLSDHTLSLSLAIRDARAKEKPGKMLLVLDTLTDVILRYKGLTTRRWLTDFVSRRKAEGFTIVATLNPLAISKEEMQTVIDVFDGVIEIFEKELRERSRRFVVVKKMYGRKYSESELMLDKNKLF